MSDLNKCSDQDLLDIWYEQDEPLADLIEVENELLRRGYKTRFANGRVNRRATR